ncbi:uncharacterized protein N7446_010820 [Penicillium canescens]|uniref:Uncharacterized protein n=1 Tax=Penicillium canescens TaxID=5083 RepID=A0AAD6IB06_PENCN|nr:uncharacterized protein N7446_010820 [Penicillium canescens]KAJ6041289.1 hypothetical protein N7460_006679 [Penicillium canescens]KAJ6050711.1 hypothetical protein N7446_010820 [Penicillium canescens]KAJ6065932.1 hypothetical protein N7444_001585 [Penicillium canescens]
MALVEDSFALIHEKQIMLPLLVLSITAYATLWLVREVWDPLRSVPGPTTARYTALWYFHKVFRGDFHHENIKLHEEHGKIVRVAPNMYSINDLESAKLIYGHGTKFLKADWYSAWTAPAVWTVNLFAMQDVKAHGVARRQLANYYSMSSMVHYESYVDECVRIFCGKLEGFSKSKQSINMGTWLQYYAFDVITNITFGKSFGYLEKAKDIDNMIAKLDQSNLYSALAGLFPSVHAIVVRLAGSPAQEMIDYIQELITVRKTKTTITQGGDSEPPHSEKRTEDFLGKFLAAHNRDPSSFTSTHLLFGCVQNIFAGSDTTAIALSSIIFYLTQNPRCLAELREEIISAAREGSISDPVTFVQSQNLRYLQAVIKEALRMNPAVGLPLVRVVPAGGVMLCGKYFPEGTVVGINPWVAHYNYSIFGNDANIFRPERWLSEDSHAMERYFMPFGQGSRTCIGKNISLLEIGKLIPQLVRNFDFELAGRQDRLVGQNHWFVKPQGFDVIPLKL